MPLAPRFRHLARTTRLTLRDQLRRDALRLAATVRPRCTGSTLDQHAPVTLHMRVTPLDEEGAVAETREAALHWIDAERLSFRHGRPLPQRRAVIAFECPELGSVVAELELNWCRYAEDGRYISGGRFIDIWGE
jgi:hypothetical protein